MRETMYMHTLTTKQLLLTLPGLKKNICLIYLNDNLPLIYCVNTVKANNISPTIVHFTVYNPLCVLETAFKEHKEKYLFLVSFQIEYVCVSSIKENPQSNDSTIVLIHKSLENITGPSLCHSLKHLSFELTLPPLVYPLIIFVTH